MHETLGIAVCDDDKYYLDQIQSLISDILTRRGIAFFVDKYKSGEKLMEEITDLRKYDIIFLDIEMRELDGMEVAKQIRKFNYEMDIVFITVVMKQIGNGYKVNAFRYILKEDMSEGIFECMEAFLDKRENKERAVELPCVGGSRNVKLKSITLIREPNHKLLSAIPYNSDTYTLFCQIIFFTRRVKKIRAFCFAYGILESEKILGSGGRHEKKYFC